MRPILHRKVVDRLAVSAARRFGLAPLELWSRSQDRRIVAARREVMAALSGEGWSQAEIAAVWGMDPSTVAHHLAVVTAHEDEDASADRPVAGCDVDGCDRPHQARGWCDRHYYRWAMGDVTRTVTVEKRGYSRAPWRLIDSQTGAEVAIELTKVEGHGWHPKPGYDTRRDATEALGRLAARALEAEAEVVRLRALLVDQAVVA